MSETAQEKPDQLNWGKPMPDSVEMAECDGCDRTFYQDDLSGRLLPDSCPRCRNRSGLHSVIYNF